MELLEFAVDNSFGFLHYFWAFIHDNIFFIIMVMPLGLIINFMINRIMILEGMYLPSPEQEEEKKVNPMQEAIDDTKEIMAYNSRIIELKNKWNKRHDSTMSTYVDERNKNVNI